MHGCGGGYSRGRTRMTTHSKTRVWPASSHVSWRGLRYKAFTWGTDNLHLLPTALVRLTAFPPANEVQKWMTTSFISLHVPNFRPGLVQVFRPPQSK